MPPSVPISAVSVMIRDFTLLRCLRRQKNHPPIAKARTNTPATAIPAIAGPARCLLPVEPSSVEEPLPSGELDVDALLLLAELKASESVIGLESLSEPIDEAIDAISDDVSSMADVICEIVVVSGAVVRIVDGAIDLLAVSRAGAIVINAILESVGVVKASVTVVVPSCEMSVSICRLSHNP